MISGMKIPLVASADVSAFTLAKLDTAADRSVKGAAAATDSPIGVFEFDAASGATATVQVQGVAEVILGGTVTRGDPITSDSAAKGVKAAPATAANNGVVGQALISGVSGDRIPVLLAPHSLQG